MAPPDAGVLTTPQPVWARIKILVLLLAIAGCGGDPAGPEDSGVDDNDLVGFWRADEAGAIVTGDGLLLGRLTIRISAITDPNDLSGGWAWNFDYGGGITTGSISRGSVNLTLVDFDTLRPIQFSGSLTADGVLSGTLQGLLGESVILRKSD